MPNRKGPRVGMARMIRIPQAVWQRMQDLAGVESVVRGKHISVADLVRHALDFAYFDDERIRECFRRAKRKASIAVRKKY